MDDVDQRGFDSQPSWLTAGEAVRLLDVKRATLYAYVSRGLVRRMRAPDGKTRYARDDVARLRARHDARAGHGPVAAGALRFGEPVLTTAISAIGVDGPRYRGQPALALAAAGTSFEAVSELLWTGTLPATRPTWPAAPPLPRAKLQALLPRRPTVFVALRLAVLALEARDEAPVAPALEVELARARSLQRALAAAAALAFDPARLEAAARAPTLATAATWALGGREDARVVAAVEEALVLAADHELNASSFAARVAASTGAGLYSCVGAALGAMSGPRHGGESDRFAAFVAECARAAPEPTAIRRGARAPARGAASAIAAAVGARARRGEAFPGFGHRLYPQGDPRGARLLATARRLGGRRLATIDAVLAAVAAQGGEAPTLDAGLAALTVALGLHPGAGAALFALGRTAGWIAHVLEQRGDATLLRPRARYIGV